MTAQKGTPPPPPADPPASPVGPEGSIEHALEAVDVSLLDQLIELRAEQARIEEYLEKAGALREKVSQVVWQRVIGDYNARSQAIDAEAAPLRIDAQREYQKLHAIRARVSAAEQEARLASEELQLRQAVGELSDDELRDKLAGPDQALQACRRDLETLEARKARFVEAFGSEERLAQAVPPPPPPPAPPAEPSATILTKRPAGAPAASAAPAAAVRTASPPPPPAEPAPAAEAPEPEEPDMTVVVRRPPAARSATRSKPASGATAGEAPAESDREDRTFVLPRAALLLSVEEGEPTVHRLAAITGMGRLDDNQLQIARAGVSRHHAVIEGTPDGFRLRDLGSQNGTFLNGERVTERVLADGDRIVIGDARLVFHSPWPRPGTPQPRGA